MATYGPRVNVHDDRYGANRQWQTPMVKWLILHTSEQSGAEDSDDAELLARYMESPGDRPSSNGGFYGASYHGVTDTDRIIPCTEDHLVAYAAGGANQYGLHLCLPVRIRPRSTTDADANTTRERWLDAGSRPYIHQAAEWIVDKARVYGIPLRRITPAQMAAGSLGYCDHNTASLAFRKSDHTDCGPAFPWDVVAADIAAITSPTPEPPSEESDMDILTARRVTDTRGEGANRDAYKCRPNTQHEIRIPEAKGAKAAQVTITVAEQDLSGHLTVWRDGKRPNTSMLNYTGGDGPVTETLFVPLDAAGSFQLWTLASTHLIVDFTGIVGK